tara:strand:- start:1963 stop:4005 length:2043 start_codon:yes stop_codon:yes gene_type:complete
MCDLTHTGLGINANVFPLGLGSVTSYLLKEMNGKVECKLFKFPNKLNDALQKEKPDVVCMSCYSWNENLTYEYAKYIKKKYPKVLIIFGGPNLPHEQEKRKNYLQRNKAIDFYIKWDGEYALTNLIKRYFESNLDIKKLKSSDILLDNVCYVDEDKYLEGKDQRVTKLQDIPSPYLTGLLDEFFNDPLTPILETNRGCPYSCTFSNDGHKLRSAVARKDPKVFEDELEYIASRASNSSHYNVLIADLNWGMYKEDLEASRIIASTMKKYNWPHRIEVSMGKSQPERLVEVANIINEAKPGVMKLAPSFQTTDLEVLKNIRRKNISMDQLLSMRGWADKDTNLEFFTELILALPGDSLKKHYQTLEDCIDTLSMNYIDLHQLSILKGSEMETTAYRKLHQLKSKHRVWVGCVGIYKLGEKEIPCAEIEEVVVESKSLTFDDYINCRIMNLLVKIYVDHDHFREVLGVIKKYKLSIFQVLKLLKEDIFPKYPSLVKLIDSYVHHSKQPLFDSHEEIMKFVSDINNTKKYISGELGQNELANHRVMAYMENLGDLYKALKEAVTLYLKNKGLLTSDIENYFEEAVEISRDRKFNFNNYDHIGQKLEKEISFDFVKAEKEGFLIEPSENKTKRKKIKLFYDDKQIEVINDMIKRHAIYSNSLHEKGKVYSKGNTRLLNRKISYI